jgi:oxygen-independent coproporphyrinogen-3 oxidase
LPEGVRAGAGPFGVYVHVPFCTSRCGYCDFNTYTFRDIPDNVMGPASYLPVLRRELDLASRVLRAAGPLPAVDTVFFGGGTPSLLPAADITAFLADLAATFGLARGVEVTVEANPESVGAGYLEALVAGGVSRVSLGMQSASPHVLAVLDRAHTPGRVADAVAAARAAGVPQVSLDLIYGAPGETDGDWRRSLRTAIDLGPDHLSAYALTVEPGTRLAAPTEDVLADRYVIADELLGQAGYRWYEISNWARSPAARCRHNLGYWSGGDWWGFGPGAHSHVGGVRWWNVRHPVSYARRLAAGTSPGAGRERLDARTRRFERVMLETRRADGLPLAVLSPAGRSAARAAATDGLLHLHADTAVLTTRGRLLADAVVRALAD